MKRYNGTHWDVMICDETAFIVPQQEERSIRYYFPDQEIPVKFTFNGEEIIPDTKEKEIMGEDKPITKYYHAIEEKGTIGKFEPLGEVRSCSFTISPVNISDDFYKDVLGINPPKPKYEWIPFRTVRKYNIAGYEYARDENNGVAITTIHWHNGDTTTCRAPLDKADQYTGFMIAVAKYAMGNKNEATNAADYWINKRPAQLKKIKEKVKAEEAEIKRITDKRRKRREEYRLRLAAIRRKEAYEAAKLANEKYGVPMDFKEDGED